MVQAVERRSGRNYRINYISALEKLMDFDPGIEFSISPDQDRKNKNIHGFVEHLYGDLKGVGRPTIPFNKIVAFQRKPSTQEYEKYFGPVSLFEYSSGFDFVRDSSGNVLIPRDTPVVEIRVPTVDFSAERGLAITPRMLTAAFSKAADFIVVNGLKPEMVIGLTHPRMGSLAQRRWGFQIEDHPFPPEVYEVIDLALKDGALKPEDSQNLQAVREQVLLYQTREDFIKRGTVHGNVIYQASETTESNQPIDKQGVGDKAGTDFLPEVELSNVEIVSRFDAGRGIVQKVIKGKAVESGEDVLMVIIERDGSIVRKVPLNTRRFKF